MGDFFKLAGESVSIIKLVLAIWGGVSLLAIAALGFAGVLSVLLRLGTGLTRRKIAILANGANQESLCHLLIDSKLFSEKRLIKIASIADLGRAELARVFLLHWGDWGTHIDDVLQQKKDATALILYAPPGSIPKDVMERLDQRRNVVVTNFRGRLLNDLIVSMITTGYEKN